MLPRLRFLIALALTQALLAGVSAVAQAGGDTLAETIRALGDARSQSRAAGSRAELLEAQAARATALSDRTARQAAAVAARIAQAEAETAAITAQIRLLQARRDSLRADLARRQQPLALLTAGLARMARRPFTLALFQPGPVMDTVHTKALIASTAPLIRQRTAALRADIAQAHTLQDQLQRARLALDATAGALADRRQALAALEARQRLAARAAGGSADLAAEHALALAERTRDLGALVVDVGREDELRAQLAALPGPVMRPGLPDDVPVAPPAGPAPIRYILPLTGRLVAGFDAAPSARSRGISVAAAPFAQVVAPAAGHVAFAAPYRGYGLIVILTHDAGWTSLLTGLARLDVRVGDVVIAGAPLGNAGPGRSVVTLELRHDGVAVDPLDYAGH